MSTEAAVAEQVPGAPAEDQQTPVASENPQDNTPQGEETPQDTTPQDTGVPPPKDEVPFEQTQIQMYQDVIAKNKEDSAYEMSDEEAEAFLYVQDRIANGEMEEPGTKPDEKPPEEKPESTPGKEGEGDEDAAPVIEDVDPDSDNLVDGISDPNSQVLISAMKRVGAKDISELDGKIEGLINHMKSSGGKKGSELAALKQREASHIQFLQDLKDGKPQAVKYLKETVGVDLEVKTKQSTPPEGDSRSPEDDSDFSSEEYLDDKLAAEVNSLKKLVKDQNDTIKHLTEGDKKREEAHSRKNATDGWVDDIVDLVSGDQTAFKLKPGEARTLAKMYWEKGPTHPVHPKFQPVHELLKFAYERSMPDLKSAYIVWQHETGYTAQKIIQATKTGQKSVQHKPSQNAFISQKQAKQKTNVPSPNISEEDVTRMERGDFDAIPDDWMDKEGNLIPSKVPERFHQAAFGRMGKPK